MKCINKKNLAKSQTLLGKEIKILKVNTNVRHMTKLYNSLLVDKLKMMSLFSGIET